MRQLLRLGALLGAVCVVVPASAAAAPGNPGVPGPPQVVFTEDFENVPNQTNAQLLANYTGAAPLAMTYTAHPAWLNSAACNGVIASWNATTSAGSCPSGIYNSFIRPIARGMGAALGGGDANHVMSDVTISGFPAPATPAATLETTKPIPLPSTNRFITFSVSAGAVTCNGARPLLRFFLLAGANTFPASNNAINACTDPRGATVNGVRVGTYPSDHSNLVNTSQIGLRLTNDQTSGSGNDYAVDNIRVLDSTPQLDKAFGPDTVSGVPTSLTFTITNTNDLAAKPGWSFTDTLPAGLTVASPTGATTTCANGAVTATAGGTEIDVAGNLLANQASCTATVSVVSSAPGSFQNCETNISDVVGLDLPACDTLNVGSAADLGVTKTPASQVINPGAPVSFTIGVTNNGPDAASGVVLTDTVPPEIENISAPGCTVTAPTVTCNVGPLALNANASFTVSGTIRADAGGTVPVNNVAVTSTSADLVAANDAASAQVLVPPLSDLSITKSDSPDPVRAGQQLTYTLAVANAGPTDSDPTSVTDTLPGGITFNDAASDSRCDAVGQAVTCSLGMLASGGDTSITIVTDVDLATRGAIENTATVDGPNNDQDPDDNSDQETTLVDPPASDLALVKTASAGPFSLGQEITYSFTVTNNGPDDEPQAVVADTLPAGLTYVSDTGNCDTSALPAISCDLGSIASGATESFTITVRVDAINGTSVTNSASVSGTNSDPDPGNDSDGAVASLRVPPSGPRLAIEKSTKTKLTRPGAVVGYRITVRNTGEAAAENVRVCDKLPKQQVPGRAPGADSKSKRKVCWNLGDLAAGAKRTVTILTRVRQSARAGNQKNIATATAANVTGRRTDAEQVRVAPAPDTCRGFSIGLGSPRPYC